MELKINDDKVSCVEVSTDKEYEIEFISPTGKITTGLAKMAAKSFWFDKDNPQYKPGTIQSGELLENGKVKIHMIKK